MSQYTAPVLAPFGLRYRRALKLDEPIVASSLSAEGRKLATASPGGTVRLWDLDTGSIGLDLKRPAVSVNALALAHAGRTLAIAAKDGIGLWDTEARCSEGLSTKPVS